MSDEKLNNFCLVCNKIVLLSEIHYSVDGRMIHYRNIEGRECFQEWKDYQKRERLELALVEENIGDC